jgi:hypothetical protein
MTTRMLIAGAASAGAIIMFGLGQTAIASAGQIRDRPAVRLEALTGPEIVFSGWPGVAAGIIVFGALGATLARGGETPARAALIGALAMFAAQAASLILQPLVFPMAEFLSVPPIASATWFIHGIAAVAAVTVGTPLAAAITWLAALAFRRSLAETSE